MNKKPPHPEPPRADGDAPDDQRVYPREIEYPGPGAIRRVEEIETGIGLDARQSRALAKVVHDAVREGLKQQNREMRLCFRAIYNMLDSVGENLGGRIDRLEKKMDEGFDKMDEMSDKAERREAERFEEAERRFEKAERREAERFEEAERREAERFEEAERRFEKAERREAERFEEAERRFEKAERREAERFEEAERRFEKAERREAERFEEAERRAAERFEEAERRAAERFDRLDEGFDRLDEGFAELKKLILCLCGLTAALTLGALVFLIYYFDSAVDRFAAIVQHPPALVATAPSPQPSVGGEGQAGDLGGNAGATPDSGVVPVPQGAAPPAGGAGGGSEGGSNGD